MIEMCVVGKRNTLLFLTYHHGSLIDSEIKYIQDTVTYSLF